MKNLLFPIFCFAALLFGCKKDAEETRSAILTSTDCWAMTKLEFYDATTQIWEDFTLDCFTDNCWSFQKDGGFVWDNGPIKCSINDQQIITGSWNLSQNGAILTVMEDGHDSASRDIIELTKDRLITQDSLSFSPYTLYRDTYEPK